MRFFACLLAVTVVSLVATSQAQAAEPNGNVDQATLASMGLSGLEVMSDEEGQDVRGTFALAYGFGSSSFFGTSTHYDAYGAGGYGQGTAAGGSTTETGITGGYQATGLFGVQTSGLTFGLSTYATGSSWASFSH